MILEKQMQSKPQEILVGEKGNRIEAKIRPDNLIKIMTMLATIYKDKYGTIPLEYLSNSWDSHLAKGCLHEPIIAELKKDINDKWYFAALDFGEGISPERIHNFTNYGDSTKDTDALACGAYGLGCKVFVSYSKKLFVETIFDGIKYTYLCCLDEYGMPGTDLLDTEPSELSNRSKVWFYLLQDEPQPYNRYGSSYNSWKSEATKFYDGIKRRTAYFDNLVYDIDSSFGNLNNNKLITGKYFKYSESQPYQDLHLIIKGVPYEIDWTLLGLLRINVPIGIIINDGVIPLPTRETYTTTTKVIEIIKEAIKLASTELVEYCNKDRVDVNDWKIWLDTRDKQLHISLGKDSININELVKYSTTPLKEVFFTPLKDVENTSNLGYSNLFPFHCVAKIQNGRKSDNRVDNIKYTNNDKKLSIEGQFKSKVNSHIGKSDSLVYVFRKKNFKLKDYKSLLMLKRSNRDTWRQQITCYQKFVEQEWLTIKAYDDIVVPREIKVKGVRIVKPREVVNINVLREREKYDSTFKSATDVWPIKDFEDKRFNKLCIYGTKDDSVELDAIWRCISNSSMMVFHLTENNHKYLTNHQFVHVKNWHKTKAFSRIITSYKIKQLLEKNKKFTGDPTYDYLKNETYNVQLGELSNTYKRLVNELDEYQKKNLKDVGLYALKEKFMETAIETADTEKLWDYSIYYKIQQLEDMIEKFKFVEVFKPDANWLPVATNYIKKVTKNVRLNLNFYQHESR